MNTMENKQETKKQESTKFPYTGEQIVVDPTDLDSMRKLMDKYGEVLETMIFGESESGEFATISINPDHIITEHLQDNGWVRKNVYWYDGRSEETFRKDDEDY